METRTIGGGNKPTYGVGKDEFTILFGEDGVQGRAEIGVAVESANERDAIEVMDKIRDSLMEIGELDEETSSDREVGE